MSTQHIVVDVGNSRIKWGRCDGQVVTERAILPLHDSSKWEQMARQWRLTLPVAWTVSGSNHPVLSRFQEWLQARGERGRHLHSHTELPIRVAVEHPDRVGIDRLLNAVAANSRRPWKRPAIIVDVGSAVTVDQVDAQGVFRGGAIFPGLRLMARALNAYTAKLPLIEIRDSQPMMPGTSTEAAITAGIHGAVVGGIHYLVQQLRISSPQEHVCYLTGGDATLLAPALGPEFEVWEHMTLEGIRLAAAALP